HAAQGLAVVGGGVVEHGDVEVLILLRAAVDERLLQAADGPRPQGAVLALADDLERLGRVAEVSEDRVWVLEGVLEAEVVEVGAAAQPQQGRPDGPQQPARSAQGTSHLAPSRAFSGLLAWIYVRAADIPTAHGQGKSNSTSNARGSDDGWPDASADVPRRRGPGRVAAADVRPHAPVPGRDGMEAAA